MCKALCPAHGSYSVMANTFPTRHFCHAIFSLILSFSFPSAFFGYSCRTDCKFPQPYCHVSYTYVLHLIHISSLKGTVTCLTSMSCAHLLPCSTSLVTLPKKEMRSVWNYLLFRAPGDNHFSF